MASSSQVATLQPATMEEHISYRSESLTRKALRRLRRDYLTLLAMAVILMMALLALGAPNRALAAIIAGRAARS